MQIHLSLTTDLDDPQRETTFSAFLIDDRGIGKLIHQQDAAAGIWPELRITNFVIDTFKRCERLRGENELPLV